MTISLFLFVCLKTITIQSMSDKEQKQDLRSVTTIIEESKKPALPIYHNKNCIPPGKMTHFKH